MKNSDTKNKVKDSVKRNALGITTAIATVITWISTSFFAVVIPPEVAISMAGILLMIVSEIKGGDKE